MNVKKSLLILFTLIASLQMTACVSPTKPLTPQISANLMTDCEDLKQLETGEMGEALTWTVDTSEQYAECRAKVRAWIKVGKALK